MYKQAQRPFPPRTRRACSWCHLASRGSPAPRGWGLLPQGCAVTGASRAMLLPTGDATTPQPLRVSERVR